MNGLRPEAFDPEQFAPERRLLARIDESTCIGCTLCIAACPVDAIVGAKKLMHTVLVERCIGCELCLPPCPVDCIDLLPSQRDWTEVDAQRARTHFAQRQARFAAARAAKAAVGATTVDNAATARRRAAVAAAFARARARRVRRGS